MEKPTLATVKRFIKKNFDALFINVKSEFDGMYDGCQTRNAGFQPVQKDNDKVTNDATLGIKGAWFVRSSRDYITPYNEPGFIGFSISNSCGRFILAIKNEL